MLLITKAAISNTWKPGQEGDKPQILELERRHNFFIYKLLCLTKLPRDKWTAGGA